MPAVLSQNTTMEKAALPRAAHGGHRSNPLLRPVSAPLAIAQGGSKGAVCSSGSSHHSIVSPGSLYVDEAEPWPEPPFVAVKVCCSFCSRACRSSGLSRPALYRMASMSSFVCASHTPVTPDADARVPARTVRACMLHSQMSHMMSPARDSEGRIQRACWRPSRHVT